MFLKARVEGLQPDAAYTVEVSVDLATNGGSVGIGGSPGESVFITGASTQNPSPWRTTPGTSG